MLIVRRAQLAAFEVAAREDFVERMCGHLRLHFPALATARSLRDHVVAALEDAAHYGFSSEQDCCRYLNLAATYGWKFHAAAEREWMYRALTNIEISFPSERLRLLVDECLHRQAVAEKNRRIRAAVKVLAPLNRQPPQPIPSPPAPLVALKEAGAQPTAKETNESATAAFGFDEALVIPEKGDET